MEYILTKRGNVNIRDIVQGDVVYSITGLKSKVVSIEHYNDTKLYQVSLSDNRYAHYTIDDLFVLGNNKLSIEYMINNIDKIKDIPIKSYPINYKSINTTLIPDPYIAGALLVNGDQSDEYVNMPSSQLAANYHFSTTYGMEYGEKIGSDISYYSNNPYDKSDLLTWDCMFPHYNIYCKNSMYDKIPREYMMGSLSDRWKFIMGAFDIGYYSDAFPDSIGIAVYDVDVLMLLQKMMFSVGITSRIEYEDVSIPSKPYHLIITGMYRKSPKVFYSVENIKETILYNQWMKNHDRVQEDVFIKDIIRIDNGSSYKLHLDGPTCESYLLSNFMHKISI